MTRAACIAVAVTALAFYATGELVSHLHSPTYDSDSWTSETVNRDYAIGNSKDTADVPERFLPDRSKTPGAVFKEVTLEDIKQPGYSARVRNVPESEKRKVAEMYGVTMEQAKSGEFDHLVPCAIGGAQGPDNIWWQPGPTGFRSGPWNFKVKDSLEREALKLVREGKLDLKQTQRDFASNWVFLYKRLMGSAPKAATILDEEQ